MIDITAPANPVDAGTFSVPMCGNCFSYPSILTLAEDYAYLSQGDGGLFIFRFGKSIAGRITHANGLPAPLAGVTISATVGLTTTTDLSGAYLLDNLPGNPRTFTPSSAGYIFSPESRTITSSSDVRGQDFVALTGPVTTMLAPGTPVGLVSTDTQGQPTQLDFPAGAVTTNTTVVLTPTVAEGTRGWTFAGHAFDLAATQNGAPVPDLAFSVPVTIMIDYSAGVERQRQAGCGRDVQPGDELQPRPDRADDQRRHLPHRPICALRADSADLLATEPKQRPLSTRIQRSPPICGIMQRGEIGIALTLITDACE